MPQSKPKSRRTRKNARSEILRVFAILVARDGYGETSISSVARELGLSKGTVVHHFSSKSELLAEVHMAYMRRRLEEAHEILATVDTSTGQLAAIVYALLRSHRDDREATTAFLREIVRFSDGGPMEAVRAQRTVYTSLVEGIVRRGVEEGAFETADIRLSTLQIFGMCNYAWTWYRPDGPDSVEEIAKLFLHTVLSGLVPRTGEAATRSEEIDEVIDKTIATVGRVRPAQAESA